MRSFEVCDDCAYTGHTQQEAPCTDCDPTQWVASGVKDCRTCKFYQYDPEEDPCNTCVLEGFKKIKMRDPRNCSCKG
jgi:hypothetical protein